MLHVMLLACCFSCVACQVDVMWHVMLFLIFGLSYCCHVACHVVVVLLLMWHKFSRRDKRSMHRTNKWIKTSLESCAIVLLWKIINHIRDQGLVSCPNTKTLAINKMTRITRAISCHEGTPGTGYNTMTTLPFEEKYDMPWQSHVRLFEEVALPDFFWRSGSSSFLDVRLFQLIWPKWLKLFFFSSYFGGSSKFIPLCDPSEFFKRFRFFLWLFQTQLSTQG